MRDAAGTNGEFYTPRPIIRFIVNMIQPNLKRSERILDPACGTGGFLIESLEFMKKDERSTTDYEKLRYRTLYGIEKKPMPHLLCMMNMLLHEVDKPNVVRMNTLTIPLKEVTGEMQYHVVMTNPPFGGEEESRIAKNLPVGMQTTDTALAFMLFIMESLKEEGRCAIILPNGPLFGGGIAAKVKEELLIRCNLHTIIRLPETVFSPYAGIATNILFFSKPGPTNEIWYYHMKTRDGLKAYNKTHPIAYGDFSEVIAWWNNREENQNAWKVAINEIKDYNLDIKKSESFENESESSAQDLINNILKGQEDTLTIIREIKTIIENETSR
jgi:type I restriction enzyme M protein